MQTDVNQDDGCDESGVSVAENQGYCPCDDLHSCSEQIEFSNAKPRNQFSHTTGSNGSHDSAKSEHSYHITSCAERWLRQMERQTRPYCHHTAEPEGCTGGIDADRRMEKENFCYRGHQPSVGSYIVALHFRHHQQHDSHAKHHHESSYDKHLPPSQPFADVTADYS